MIISCKVKNQLKRTHLEYVLAITLSMQSDTKIITVCIVYNSALDTSLFLKVPEPTEIQCVLILAIFCEPEY